MAAGQVLGCCVVLLLQTQKQCFGWLWGAWGYTMAEAGRMREEEGAGKVGRVSLNNVALHAAFRACVRARACFVWMKQTAQRLARSPLSSSFLFPN